MIEFESIAAAEAAIGRNLTIWELKWFEYTANVSDFKLYSLNVVSLILVANLAPLPSVLPDLLKVKFFEKYRLQKGASHSREVIWQCYKRIMMLYIIIVGPFTLSAWPVLMMVGGIHGGLPLPSPQTILLQLTIYALIEDYIHYWIHRWLHSDWAYKNIHYLHHEFKTPMGFTPAYAHVAEVFVLGGPTVVAPLLASGHIVSLWLWIALRQIEAVEVHSGYDFPWSPLKLIPFYGGSHYHDYHHVIGGKGRSNFASFFPHCDWLYGTNKGYRYQKSLLDKASEQTLGKEKRDRKTSFLCLDWLFRARAKTT